MKLRIKRLLMTACMAVIALMSSAQNEAMTNETVLELLKEGFSSEEIIGAIENSTERKITYSIDFMRQLKAAGAEPSLTTFIQKVAKTDFGYEGILWWNPTGGGKPKKNGKGGRRLFPDKMSYSVLGFEGTNASNRNIIDFEINEINNNTFEVTFPKELEPGEYCFFYKGGLGSESFKEHPFGFDFTVK